MDFFKDIKKDISRAIDAVYQINIKPESIILNETRKEFNGDYTFVVFPLVKELKKKPLDIGNEIGHWLVDKSSIITDFETVQGFLNLTLSNSFWMTALAKIVETDKYGYNHPVNQKVLVEFASPNTNKPLHLGHIRNILLGWSCSKILKANGYDVVNTQIVNDRGIAICKSILAWQKFGNGATPESSGIKGDHLIGDYYVAFEKAFVEEYKAFQISPKGDQVYQSSGSSDSKEDFFKKYKNAYFNDYSTLGAEAREMLIKWENSDQETLALWRQMNQWVYDGFAITYKKLGVSFDTSYYESNTYLLGKKVVDDGLEKGIFYKKDDQSVWID